MARRCFRALAALSCLLWLLSSAAAQGGGGKASLGGVDVAGREALFADHLRRLAEIGARREGSAAEARAAELIAASSKAAGLAAKDLPLSGLEAAQSYSRALTVGMEGVLPDSLVFMIPLDNREGSRPGEGDAAIALALAEIDLLGARLSGGWRPPLGIEFVFLGADEDRVGPSGSSPGPGTQWWIDGLDAGRAVAVVYLALDGVPGTIGLMNAMSGSVAPYWLYERTRSALAGSGFPYALNPNRMQGYRLGLLERSGNLASYLRSGIPAVELVVEGGQPIASPFAAFAAFIDGLAEGNSSGFLDTWDRNYSSFQVGAFTFVVREGPYVIFLLCFVAAVAALVLFLSVTRREFLPTLARKLPHRLLNVLVLGGIALVALLASRLSTQLEGLILGSTQAWTLSPAVFALGRLAMSVLLFLGLVSIAVTLRLLTPDPWFYELVALALFGGDVLLFAFLSLPLSLYFCWSFAVALVSVLVRRKVASLVAIAFLVLPFALLAAEMFAAPKVSALARIVAPDALSGTVLAIVLIPFAAMAASPLLFFAPRGLRGRRRAALVFIGLALATEVGLLAHLATISGTAPVYAAEEYLQDSGSWSVALRSPLRIGHYVFERGGRRLEVDSATGQATVEGRDRARVFRIEVGRKAFLDRLTTKVSIDAETPPTALELHLSSAAPLVIYDCSLPYRVDLEGRGAEIFAGPGRPDPLEFAITTDAAFSARLSLTALYPGSSTGLASRGGRPLVPEYRRVEASVDLGGP